MGPSSSIRCIICCLQNPKGPTEHCVCGFGSRRHEPLMRWTATLPWRIRETPCLPSYVSGWSELNRFTPPPVSSSIRCRALVNILLICKHSRRTSKVSSRFARGGEFRDEQRKVRKPTTPIQHMKLLLGLIRLDIVTFYLATETSCVTKNTEPCTNHEALQKRLRTISNDFRRAEVYGE